MATAAERRPFALVLDAGTTTVRAMAFAPDGTRLAHAGAKLKKTFPRPGWVEQKPDQLVTLAAEVLRNAVAAGRLDVRDCRGVGLTNQRETTVMWDAATGRAVHPAIVWEDRRTAAWCRALAADHAAEVRALTGLALEPYFSATKISWLLAHAPRARALLEAGRLRCGTVDSWLLWHLAEGNPHVTDVTNAHRTLLVDARRLTWSDRLLEIFKVPRGILPAIHPSRHAFGELRRDLLGRALPIRAVCGDQQSSLYAAWRFSGKLAVTKITYGTGTFVDQTAGRRFRPHDGFYAIVVPHPDGGAAYGLEGKIERGARQVDELLGDDAALRRFLKKLAGDTDRLVRRLPHRPRQIIVDGGVSRDGLVGGFQAAITGIPVTSLPTFDGTALGAAYLTFD
jgi:glycerol kinase